MRVLIFLCLIWSCAIVKAEECEPSKGKKQSPVNINTAQVKSVSATPFVWSKEYSQSQSWELINTGHTCGNLGATYNFEQLHFHWGTTNDKGSEHTINNQSFPLEMHAVHSQYNTPNAKKHTVVTYFFKIAEQKNKFMEKILAPAIKAANNKNVPQEVQPFALSDFAKKGSSTPYYAYDGSLTTPKYTESVNWIIFTNFLTLSQTQMNIFRDAAKIEKHFENNYRCLQKLNGRVISLVKQSSAFYTNPHRG